MEQSQLFAAGSPTLTTTRSCFTCHGVKQLVGLQVREDGAAVGAAEGRTVGGVSLVRLDAAPDVVQLVLDHVDQQSGRKQNRKQHGSCYSDNKSTTCGELQPRAEGLT